MPQALHSLYLLTGASRGLGLAMAGQLLKPEHGLLTLSRRPSQQLADDARDRQVGLTQWAVDLAEPEPIARRLHGWLTNLAERQGVPGRVVLIHNAGLLGDLRPLRAQALSTTSAGPTHSHTQAATPLQAVLRVGLEAPMVLTAAFLAATSAWPADRRVLCVSSGLGRRAMSGGAAYCAAKAGLDHFSRCVALEEAGRPHGARIAAVAPGVIDTDMQQALRSADDVDLPERERYRQLQAQGQLTSADAAAERLLAHLHSDAFGDEPVADIRTLPPP